MHAIFSTDVNECQTANGGCAQACTDTDASFLCSCGSGYTLAYDGFSCNGMNSCNVYTRVILMVITDVDECSEKTDGCSQICSNTIGSFMCSCGSGYTLANDNLGCNGKNDLCSGSLPSLKAWQLAL